MFARTRITGRIIAASSLVVSASLCLQASAQNWEITPSIYASVLSTDNVFLLPGDAEVSDTSYELSPQIVVNKEGKRFRLNSNYRLQVRRFQDNGQLDQNFHNLNLNTDTLLISDQLGVTGNAIISQQVINRSQGVGVTTASGLGNVTNIGTYSVEPYFNFNAGTSTQGRISYRLGLVEFEEPQLIDSKNQRFLAAVSTNPDGKPWSVGANVSLSTAEFDPRPGFSTSREVDFNRVSVDLGYGVSPRADLVLTIGNDDNDLGTGLTTGDTDGAFWLFGLRGTLGASTNYEVRVGEQFFGDSYLVQFNRQRGRLGLTLSYTEQATNFAAAQLGGLGGGAGGGAGGSAPLNYDQLLRQFANVGGTDLPDATDDVFVSKRLNVGLTYSMVRSTWQFTIFNDDRDFLTVPLAGNALANGGTGATLRWNWQSSGRMTLSLSANYQRFDIGATTGQAADEPEDLRFDATLRRDLGQRAYMNLRLIHNERKSNISNRNFSQNSILVGAGYGF